MTLGENMRPERSTTTKKNTKAINTSKGSLKKEGDGLKQAIDTSWAFIEFEPNGIILDANELFVKTLGYDTLDELKGQHHRIFCDSNYAASQEYLQFWEDLAAGKSNSGEYKRLLKSGEEIWINASYTPIKNDKGKVYKVVKIANEITSMVLSRLNANAVQSAVDAGWASIEFEPDGTIITANTNFISALGYSNLDQIKGQHHRMFCDEQLKNSSEYAQFWKDLGAGQIKSGEFKRVRKDGAEVWINASYTPVKNEEGTVYKIVKIAADITDMVTSRLNADAVQSAVDAGWAFIEFEPDGTIIKANNNFVAAVEYSEENEIIGRHHRIFCEDKLINSIEYQQFWKNLANGEIQQGEFKRITKSGKEIWINASYTPIRDLEGKVYKVIKIASDITEMVNDRVNASAVQNAVDTGWASIEFKPDGTILSANENFKTALGYFNDNEIVGNHHRMFCDQKLKNSHEYAQFWQNLANGQIQNGEFKRVRKDGTEVWINASYTPVKNTEGIVYKIIKIATDITDMVASRLKADAVQAAVDTGWASIEFESDGTIINANDNFVQTLGYNSVNEITGNHHRIFCEQDYAMSNDYQRFWKALGQGQVQSGEFKRISKQGREVWINASYTPIRDLEGNIVKVIKIAADVTDMVKTRESTMAVFNQLTQAIQEMVEGNFDYSMLLDNVDLDTNAQKVIEDIATLQGTLNNIMVAIGDVVEKAGKEGDMQARLRVEEAKGSWRDLTDGINQLIQSIAEPLMEFNKIMNAMAEGDLSNRFMMRSAGDIQNMGDNLNKAMENMTVLLNQIEKNAKIAADSSKIMMNKSEAMKGNTGEVASAIAQMSQGAQDQAVKTDESSQLVNEVMESANEMANKADIINQAAERGQGSCDNGMKIMKVLLDNMDEIMGSASMTSDSINILKQRAEEIARTLNVITDIAAQTNLLALNAAIEAARAGDAGRGFAVVAEEIRKLAEDSRQSAVDIEKIIGDVQKDTQEASKAIENMEGSVKQGNSASKEAEEIFLEISTSSNDTLSLSKDIQEASTEQKGSINKVVKNIEQIVVVAEETAAGSQQVSGSAQELNAGMIEVSENSEETSRIAADLLAGVNQFKLA